MGGSLLVGVPCFAVAMAVGGPIAIRVVLGLFVAVMAVLALASAGVAVWKGGARHSVGDLFWLTLTAALGCALAIQTDVLWQLALVFGLVIATATWWTNRTAVGSQDNYLLRLVGNFLMFTLAAVLFVPLIIGAIGMVLNGQGR